VVDLLLVLLELFRQLSQLRRCERIFVEIVVLERGWVTFKRKFPGEWRSPPTTVGVRKLEFLGYHVTSRGVVCVIPRLAVVIQYARDG